MDIWIYRFTEFWEEFKPSIQEGETCELSKLEIISSNAPYYIGLMQDMHPNTLSKKPSLPSVVLSLGFLDISSSVMY